MNIKTGKKIISFLLCFVMVLSVIIMPVSVPAVSAEGTSGNTFTEVFDFTDNAFREANPIVLDGIAGRLECKRDNSPISLEAYSNGDPDDNSYGIEYLSRNYNGIVFNGNETEIKINAESICRIKKIEFKLSERKYTDSDTTSYAGMHIKYKKNNGVYDPSSNQAVHSELYANYEKDYMYTDIDNNIEYYVNEDGKNIFYVKIANFTYLIAYIDSISVTYEMTASGDGWYVDNNYCLHITGAVTNPSSRYDNKTPWYNCKDVIKTVIAEPGSSVDNCADLFSGCYKLVSADLSNLDMSKSESLFHMFSYCKKLETVNISNFDTSRVNTMFGMFLSCPMLKSVDVSGFDTSKVTDMGCMFNECGSLTSLDVSGFDTSNVTNMGRMFCECSGLTSLDVSKFVTDDVRDMGSMFSSCEKLKTIDLSNFNTGNVDNMSYMFSNCSGLEEIDLSSFVTDNVTLISSMFENCASLKTLDLSNFNTSKAEQMYHVFDGCTSLETLNIGNFSTDGFAYSMYDPFSYIFDRCTELEELTVSKVVAEGASRYIFELSPLWRNKADGTVYNSETGFENLENTVTLLKHDHTCEFTKYRSLDGCHIAICKDCERANPDGSVIPCSGGNATCKEKAKCADCGAEYGSLAEHTGGTATCKAKAKCSVCGTEYGSLATHTYPETLSSDGTNHWYTCSVCGNKKDVAVHTGGTATCTEKAKCSVCNTEYGSLKDHSLNTVTTKATVSANGKTETKCSVCNTVTKTTVIYYPKEFKLSYTSYTYNGKAKKPTVTVSDSNGKTVSSANYSVSYLDSTGKTITSPINAGSYKVKVTFNGNYSGTKTVSYKIKAAAGAAATLSYTSKAYTGSTLKPTVTVKNSSGAVLKSGTDYTVSYLGADGKTVTPKAVGTYTVKVTMKGNYSGTLTKTYKINPKTTSISSPVNESDGITVKWSKNTSASGYYIYRSINGAAYKKVKTLTANSTISWKDTGAKTNGTKYQYKIIAYKTVNGTTYKSAYSTVKTIYFVSRPSAPTLTNGTASKLTVKWSKNSKASGYQIQYALKSDFSDAKTVTVTGNSTVSKIISGLTKGKTYNVRIRAFKTSEGVKHYSAWSAKKSLKIK